MSYKIEITADSLNELSGKLMALAASMHAIGNVASDPVMPEVREAPKAKRAKAEKPVEVAETPVGEPVTAAAETASSPSDTATAMPGPNESGETATSTDASSESSVSLDFDKDVAPVVLKAVAAKGKPWVQEILSQFGVERASQVPDAQLGELLSVIEGGLA